MTDSFNPKKRSQIMRAIKGKNTKPEIAVRKYIFSKGLRFRINVKGIPGKPDIFLRKYKVAIFVNGCFWHGHEKCKHSHLPKSNTQYWSDKIERNKNRDILTEHEIVKLGIKPITIWTCEIETTEKQKKRLERLIFEIKTNA